VVALRRKRHVFVSQITGRTDFSLSSHRSTVTNGIPGFFRPNPLAHAGADYPNGADHAGCYSTAQLEQTIRDLIDSKFDNAGAPAGRHHPPALSVTADGGLSCQRVSPPRRCRLERHICRFFHMPPA
jgi:hypothetical protein